MNKVYILLISIIILFSILFFLQIKTKEQFVNSNSYALNYCVNKDGRMGIRMNDGGCAPLKKNNLPVNSSLDLSNSNTGIGKKIVDQDIINNIDNIQETPSFSNINDISASSNLDNECFPSNTDFGNVCDNYGGNQFGVLKTQSCNNNQGKKVQCEPMVFNGIDYKNKDNFATPCLDRSLDFDTMCNNYMPESIQSNIVNKGYTQSSSGLKEKLIGKDGDCYVSNGKPDNSKARGICSLKHNNEIPKLDPFIYNQDTNVFTTCNKMNSSDFVDKCSSLLNIQKNNVYADISGYDCFPGYGRAKCIDKNEMKDVSLYTNMSI